MSGHLRGQGLSHAPSKRAGEEGREASLEDTLSGICVEIPSLQLYIQVWNTGERSGHKEDDLGNVHSVNI